MKEAFSKNKIYITLIAITIGTLLIAIIEHNKYNEFIASIFCNVFAGMVTGCVIAFISALKNRKKSKYVLLVTAYSSVYDCNMEFLNDKEYYNNISDYDVLYEEIYNKLSYLKFINEYIEKYKNELLKEGELALLFAEKFSYNIEEKEKEYIQLHDDLQSNLYKTEKDLLELVRKYQIAIIKLNAEIVIEINKCKSEIYKIEQSFI